jgi:hypothetical protein
VVGAWLDDGAAGVEQGSAYVFAAAETPSDTPPTIILKAPISSLAAQTSNSSWHTRPCWCFSGIPDTRNSR